MNSSTIQSDLAGLGIYAACFAVAFASAFVFPGAVSLVAVLELSAAAATATLLTAAVRHSDLAALFRDRDAAFTQALLGIAVCGGLYALVSVHPRPEAVFMAFLLWTASGLLQFTPIKVAALFVLNTAIYVNVFSAPLVSGENAAEHAETVLMLLASAVMAAFMCWRARSYTRIRREKAQLQVENAEKSEALQAAEARIHAMTVQDMDTIALKYPYFRRVLMEMKSRADKSGGTFSIGLIAVDHFDVIRAGRGELAARQLLREVADRTSKLVRNMDFLAEVDEDFQPLGRVGESLFGLILPGTNLKGAQHCADRLHAAMEFRDIRTGTGAVSITLSIGIIEYTRGENIDELFAELSRSLEKARVAHERATPEPAARPVQSTDPIKGASTVREMVLLDYKDYGRPVH
ncbi:MAG: GGDEF domain-containing protein [Bacillota bacterium]